MTNLNPGSRNTTLLHSNDEHREKHVFNGGIPVGKLLNVRRDDRQFWEVLPGMDEQVIEAVRAAGFEGIIEVRNRKIDHALITALVERWRPETHTFHLPIEEVTVTLKDVEVLWGLRVNGNVVTGSDLALPPPAQYASMCEAYMGFIPSPNAFKSGSIKLSCLLQEMNNPLPENPTHNEIEQKTRVVIMHLFGGTLFPNNTGNRVGMYHLYNLINLEACVELSWGSAVLACLYRRLCKATHYQASDVSGPLGLLQLWSWERFNNLAPTLSEINFHFQTPYGARWNVPRSYIRVTSHVLQACRSQLTSLTSNEFNWTPYSEAVLNSLPLYCTNSRNSWRCETFIIYWEIVETHLPSRVIRQFGMFQSIPNPPLFDYGTHVEIHKLTRQNNPNVDWTNKHAYFINQWLQRLAYIQNGNSGPNFALASTEYMGWYRERTVLYISNVNNVQQGFQPLGEAREFLMDGMTQIYNQSTRMMTRNPSNTQGYEDIQNAASQYMQYIQGENWLRQGSSHFQDDYQPVPMQQVPIAPRERRQQRQPDAYAGSSNVFAGTSNPSGGNQDAYLGPNSMPNEETSWMWYW